ncbi:MAG: ATP-binding protein [Sphingobium sp.]
MNEHLLTRIADALDRLAPPPLPTANLASHAAYVWDGIGARAVDDFRPASYALLRGIDAQKATLLENTQRHAAGLPAHDALIWGARGTGKSASVGAVVGEVRAQTGGLALMQCGSDALRSLPALFALLRGAERPFIVFIDDLGFDEAGGDARILRSLLDGGASARPGNVRLYVTSNRRHIVPRHLSEQDDPINKRDVVDDKMALSDRFGLSLGFHALDQDAYLDIIAGYAAHFDLAFDRGEAVQWSTQRGSRSGRVAWQYIVELAGRAGKTLG